MKSVVRVDSLGNWLDNRLVQWDSVWCRLCGEDANTHAWWEFEHSTVREMLELGDPASVQIVRCSRRPLGL